MAPVDITALVTRASELLGRGAVDEVGALLLTAWQAAPWPELSAVIAALPARRSSRPVPRLPSAAMEQWLQRFGAAKASDVAPLLEDLGQALRTRPARFVTPCLDALGRAPADPRVSTSVVGWLAASSPPLPLFTLTPPLATSMVAALGTHLDPGQTAELRALTEHAAVLSPLLQRRPPDMTPPTPDVALALSELKAQLQEVAPAPVRPSSVSLHEATLVAQVRAHPEDEHLRLVLQDWLVEHGDPWGELMVLQTQRGPEAARSARELSLLKQLKHRVAGSLEQLPPKVLKALVIERGFPTEVRVALEGSHRVEALLGRDECSTLEAVTFTKDAALTANLIALRRAAGVTAQALRAARTRGVALPLEVLELSLEADDDPLEVAASLAWLPRLRELVLGPPKSGDGAGMAVVTGLLGLPVARQLHRLEVYGPRLDDWPAGLSTRVPPAMHELALRTPSQLGLISLRRHLASWRVHLTPPPVHELWRAPRELGDADEVLRSSGLPLVFEGDWGTAPLPELQKRLRLQSPALKAC